MSIHLSETINPYGIPFAMKIGFPPFLIELRLAKTANLSFSRLGFMGVDNSLHAWIQAEICVKTRFRVTSILNRVLALLH